MDNPSHRRSRSCVQTSRCHINIIHVFGMSVKFEQYPWRHKFEHSDVLSMETVGVDASSWSGLAMSVQISWKRFATKTHCCLAGQAMSQTTSQFCPDQPLSHSHLLGTWLPLEQCPWTHVHSGVTETLSHSGEVEFSSHSQIYVIQSRMHVLPHHMSFIVHGLNKQEPTTFPEYTLIVTITGMSKNPG